MLRLRTLLLTGAIITAMISLAAAAETPVALRWAQLIPHHASAGNQARRLLFGPVPGSDVSHTDIPEADWMSIKRQQPGAGDPPAFVSDFDTKRVSISGYLVPLDLENKTINEFLLVPWRGACVHVPPPPANQVIYINAPSGYTPTGQYDSVKVTGTLKSGLTSTGLADADYSIEADTVEPRVATQ